MFAQKQLEQGLQDAARLRGRQNGADLRVAEEQVRREPAKPSQVEEWSRVTLHAGEDAIAKAQHLEQQSKTWRHLTQLPKLYRDGWVRAERALIPQLSHRPDERERWDQYLRGLDDKVASGKITEAQCRRAREVWSRAVAQTPRLRAPTAGVNEDGEYYFDWNYGDLPGLTLTLTLTREGQVDWFFRDKENKVARGTDEPTETIPGEVFTYLRFFQR